MTITWAYIQNGPISVKAVYVKKEGCTRLYARRESPGANVAHASIRCLEPCENEVD